MAGGELRYRRSPHIVSYWTQGRLVFHNFASGRRVAGNALTIGLLDYFSDWRGADVLMSGSTLRPEALRRALAQLVRASMLQRSDRPVPRSQQRMEQWADWNPAAGFFHFSTKDVAYAGDQDRTRRFLIGRAQVRPLPPSAKSYRGSASIDLPRVTRRDPFVRVLLERRTWRSFGRRPVPLALASALLRFTFGAQKLIDLGVLGPAMLRTSPSAGARHPIEAYVVARRVSGVPPGLYHYSPFEHRLVRLTRGAKAAIARHLAVQQRYDSG